jgi:hypothetical protein
MLDAVFDLLGDYDGNGITSEDDTVTWITVTGPSGVIHSAQQ